MRSAGLLTASALFVLHEKFWTPDPLFSFQLLKTNKVGVARFAQTLITFSNFGASLPNISFCGFH